MEKCKKLIFSPFLLFFYFLENKFQINRSYFCREINSEQNKPNPMSLRPKLSEELGVEKSTDFGGFLGVGGKGGGFEKKILVKN